MIDFPQGRGATMVIRMENKTGEVVTGVDQARAKIQERLQQHPQQWLNKLQENPASFAEVEQTVRQVFQQMADQMVAGLLAQATEPAEFAQAAKKK
jgi:Lhr-like helicase